MLDTNVLIRLTQPGGGNQVDLVESVIGKIPKSLFCFSLQNAAEYYSVATRPEPVNGLGLLPSAAVGALSKIEARFAMLRETEQAYEIWKKLILEHKIIGKSVHDARLAALMMSHGITQILTFDVGDFARFSQITAVHPSELVEAN